MGILRGSNDIKYLSIGNNVCDFANVTAFDLTKYPQLKSLSIGKNAFSYVDELKLIGLNELESVVIGNSSFTRKKNSWGNDPNRHFYLKNCPKIRYLRIGAYSFSDYTVCEIENVDALEDIKIGDIETDKYNSEYSYNFRYASLELRSILIHSE